MHCLLFMEFFSPLVKKKINLIFFMLSLLDIPGKLDFYFKKVGLSILLYFLSLWAAEYNRILYLLMTKPKNQRGLPALNLPKRENWSFQALKNRNFFSLKCGTAARSKSKPDTASLFCSCQKCRITPSPTSVTSRRIALLGYKFQPCSVGPTPWRRGCPGATPMDGLVHG